MGRATGEQRVPSQDLGVTQKKGKEIMFHKSVVGLVAVGCFAVGVASTQTVHAECWGFEFKQNGVGPFTLYSPGWSRTRAIDEFNRLRDSERRAGRTILYVPGSLKDYCSGGGGPGGGGVVTPQVCYKVEYFEADWQWDNYNRRWKPYWRYAGSQVFRSNDSAERSIQSWKAQRPGYRYARVASRYNCS